MQEELAADFENKLPHFLNKECTVNGTSLELEQVEKMGYEEFSSQSQHCMPVKLYKYFPNKEISLEKGEVHNYSIEALKNNTVYMQSPNNFDDIYDSDIFVDYTVYEKLRLIEYCKRSKLNVNENLNTTEIGNIFLREIVRSLNEHKSYEHIFTKIPDTEIEDLENQFFCKALHLEMQKTDDLGKAVYAVLCSEYSNFIIELKNKFRVSCFTTTPLSQLMWGGVYADCHKGFCLEYTVLPTDRRYQDVYHNLFPIIYCKSRSDISAELVATRGKNSSMQELWSIYFHGALRKNKDWAFQNEWRLLLPLGNRCEDYNIEFFPITKVFLGNRMPYNQRMQIISICKERNIPYSGVRKNPVLFELQECEILCENCPNYKI